jgi:hypothetical protein
MEYIYYLSNYKYSTRKKIKVVRNRVNAKTYEGHYDNELFIQGFT